MRKDAVGIALAIWLLFGLLVGLSFAREGANRNQNSDSLQVGRTTGGKPTASANTGPGAPSPRPATKARGGLSVEDSRTFADRFEREIWPLLVRKEAECVGCH